MTSSAVQVFAVLFLSGLTTAADPSAQDATLAIRANAGKEKIGRHIYGHFSEHLGRCIYEGIWVGEESEIPNTRGIRNDVVEALKAIKIPVLRWPGGCFADEYHWRDGIGPRESRPSMVNTHWGGVTENNHFGTHEFLDLCEQLGCEPYICGNVGSGSVEEMADWIEYITFDGKSPMADLRRKNGRERPWKVTYFGVGNESWGCGGNMRPEYYADQYRQYATFVRNFSGNQIFKIACGPYAENYRWLEVLLKEAGAQMQGIAPHYYCGSGARSRSATSFAEVDWFEQLKRALRMDELLVKYEEIMDRLDPEKKVAIILDEWGAWHEVEPGTNPGFLYQQNSLRDAMVAALTLDVFNRHCARVKMANIAQTINVLQAMILTRGEEMILTPTYHVFRLYTVHHDATLLPTELKSRPYRFEGAELPAVAGSASRDATGKIHVTLTNIDPNAAADVSARIEGTKVTRVSGKVLTAPSITEINTFEHPQAVEPKEYTGASVVDGGFRAVLPAKSIVALKIE